MLRLLRQFLPMSLSDMLMALGDPVILFFLAQLPNSTPYLAAFGLGKAVAVFFQSPVLAVLPVSNTLSASPRSSATFFRFAVILGLTMSVGLAMIGLSDQTVPLLARDFDPFSQELTKQLILLLSFWPLLVAICRYYQGRLIAAGNGMSLFGASCLRIATVAGTLTIASHFDHQHHLLAGSAMLMGLLSEMLIAAWRSPVNSRQTRSPQLPTSMAAMLRFYAPLAQSLVVNRGSRLSIPIFLASAGEMMVAGWACAWTLVMGIANGVRMLQQLVIREHEDNHRELTQFVLLVGVGFTLALYLLANTSWGTTGIHWYLGYDTAMAEIVRTTIDLMAPLAFFMALQHWIQGALLKKGKTKLVGNATLCGSILTVMWLMAGSALQQLSITWVAKTVLGCTILEVLLLVCCVTDFSALRRGWRPGRDHKAHY